MGIDTVSLPSITASPNFLTDDWHCFATLGAQDDGIRHFAAETLGAAGDEAMGSNKEK